MKIKAIMHTNPICIDKSASLKEITMLISTVGLSHVPVLDNGKLIGVVSKTDLIRRFLWMLEQTSGKHYTDMLMEHIEVENIMHSTPITIRPDDDISYARELLLQGSFHGLIVTNEKNEVVGIVTAYDILKSEATPT